MKKSVKTFVSDLSNRQKRKKDSPPRKKRQTKNSNIALMINTNIPIGEFDEDLYPFANRLNQSIKEIGNNIEDYIMILEPDHDLSYIKSVQFLSSVERAPTTDKIHAHILVCIKHYTRVRLNTFAMREKIMNDLELKGLYISHPVVMRNSAERDIARWRNYILKGVKIKPRQYKSSKDIEDSDFENFEDE